MLKKTKNPDIEKFMATPRIIKRSTEKRSVSVPEKKKHLPLAIEKRGLRRIKFSKKNIIVLILVLIFIGALATAGYFYHQYKKAMSEGASKNELVSYTAKIGKFMTLPQDETPTMATVADKDKLALQPFFAHAENGDKVLFYTKAQKAILYRPSTNMVIEASSMAASANVPSPQEAKSADNSAPIQSPTEANPEPQAAAPSAPEAQTPAAEASTAPKMATVAVYNGTFQKGLAAGISTKLASVTEVKIVSTGNAKGNYTKTTVVDLSGTNADAAQKIATTLGATVGSLPDGENKPDSTDILVIGGSDFKN